MAFSPIALTIPQYDVGGSPAAGHWMKGYAQGTITDLTMYQDAAGSTSMTRAELNADGMPVTAGNVRFIPHFGQAYDLWLFPTAAAADADDTSGAIQLADNGILISGRSESPLFKLTVAAMKAEATFVAGDLVRTLEHTSGYGYRGGNLYLARAVTGATDDNGSLIKSTGNAAIEFVGLFPDGPNVKHWGAAGDGTTDDITAFNRCRDYCATNILPMYVPASSSHYRITDTLTLTARYFEFHGDGDTKTVIFLDAVNKSAIALLGASEFNLHDFFVAGALNSYDLIQLGAVPDSGANRADNGHLYNITANWAGRYCINHINGNSVRYTNVRCDMQRAFRPAGLSAISGQLAGGAQINFYVQGASNRNHNCTFVNCQSNGGGSTYGVQIGDSGGRVDTFAWYGGLMQGSGSDELLYLVTGHSIVSGVHMESPVPATAGAWTATLDACVNTIFQPGLAGGDIRLINACQNSGVIGSLTSGVVINSDCVDCFVEKSSYAAAGTGPSEGRIKDLSGQATLRHIHNNSNVNFSIGDNISERRAEIFRTDIEQWIGTSAPCGFQSNGGTVSIETTIVRSGVRSAQFDTTTTAQYLAMFPDPVNQIAGKSIVVEAWVYNVSTVGLCNLVCDINSGAQAFTINTFQADTWERIVATFNIPSNATVVRLGFQTKAAGTIYIDSFSVSAEDFEHEKKRTFDGTATPTLEGYTGALAQVYETSGTPTITDFLDPIVGVPFTILFKGATVITDADPIYLAGGNFTGSADDTLTLVYHDDANFYELARSVN